MKTAISLPEALFRDADELARRMKTSRSDVYRQALEEFVARHDVDAITDALDRALAEIEQTTDEFSGAASRKILEQTEW